ncbi:hypothetical protein BJV78DRAFT_797115 [Lactifluus subvellereus]|nr:hypothetical protein BJV78DRAFT_797115 [Lactifluus subvellereus]
MYKPVNTGASRVGAACCKYISHVRHRSELDQPHHQDVLSAVSTSTLNIPIPMARTPRASLASFVCRRLNLRLYRTSARTGGCSEYVHLYVAEQHHARVFTAHASRTWATNRGLPRPCRNLEVFSTRKGNVRLRLPPTIPPFVSSHSRSQRGALFDFRRRPG